MRVRGLVLLALVSGWSSAAPKETREEVYSSDWCGGLRSIVKATRTDKEPPSRYQIALTHKQQTCLYWHSECPTPQVHESTNGRPSCIEGLMWCLHELLQPDLCYQCDRVYGSCETGLFLIEASQATNVSLHCQETEPPSEECFKEASIDGSCTLPLDEGAATFCVDRKQFPDAQDSAWISMTVLAAVVLALVATAAVLAWKNRHYWSPPDPRPLPQPPHDYGALRQRARDEVPPDAAHLRGENQIVNPPDIRPPGPPAVAGAAGDGSSEAGIAEPEATQNAESPGTTPELKDMGKGNLLWLTKGQSAIPADSPADRVPTLQTKSSDSEEPKQTTTDSSPPTSMDVEDGKQAAPGEGGPDASQLTLSTVGSLPTSKHPRRKNRAEPKKTADTNHSQDSSSDPDTDKQRMTRPPKKKCSASGSYDPAGLAKGLTTTSTSDSSTVERSTEVQ